MYYSIGEVAEILVENTSLVRFWSGKFSDFIKPVRNKKGNRLFTAEDVSNYKIIHHLVKDRGMTLEGAKGRMHDNREGEAKTVDILASLDRIKSQLTEIKDMME